MISDIIVDGYPLKECHSLEILSLTHISILCGLCYT